MRGGIISGTKGRGAKRVLSVFHPQESTVELGSISRRCIIVVGGWRIKRERSLSIRRVSGRGRERERKEHIRQEREIRGTEEAGEERRRRRGKHMKVMAKSETNLLEPTREKKAGEREGKREEEWRS